MSLNVKGKSCAMCKAYLFEEDDVVFCPVCGAPHHRECYNRLGHCALEEFHGTDKQYSPETEKTEEPFENTSSNLIKCAMCGENYDSEMSNCPKCQAPNMSKLGGKYVVFDFLGGVPGEMELGKDVTADEAKKFVLTNTQRYIPKFAMMKAGKKASWNWLAFFFPGPWFFSRKMYKGGLLFTAITVALSILQFPFINAISAFIGDSNMGYMEITNIIAENIGSIAPSIVAAVFISVGLSFIMKLVAGIFGDYFYRNHTLNSVADIKKNSIDKQTDYAKRGGISFLALMLSFLATEYLPQILFTLI